MTSAFVLIFSVLILGGILAALGDRLGSKVGKARLTLFNLRPKQTAVVVTVMTGTVIAASTLGLLFGLSKSLRQGVFQLDEILAQRRQELMDVTAEKEKIEKELQAARDDRLEAEQDLQEIEAKFETAQTQLAGFREQASELQADINALTTEQTTLRQQRDRLQAQSETLRAQLNQQNTIIEERSQQIEALEAQQSELQAEINQRDGRIAQLDQAIAQKDQVLTGLENQIGSLEQQIDILEANYINFRSGNVALTTGQVLAFGVVRIIDPKAASQAVDQLLREANRNAIIATGGVNPDFEARVVQITNAQVQQLLGQIADGRDYVVRLLAAGNYLQGEGSVQVFADVTLNEQVFRAGEVIATLSLEELSVQNPTAARRPVDFLLGAAQFRARRAGVLGDIQVKDGNVGHIINFVEALNNSPEPVTEIRAIAIENGFTAGPLRLELVGLSNGRIVIRQ
ncbi:MULTISPECIES: DUF3084 domain-containing protein [Cyanophyceae]|nr:MULTISPECIES: DUF3084 domain-containing protein [Cyanophyceae]AAK49023.1 hypothetical protein [Picosynechococcus sp. PCC 7002]ACA99663.1 conserved hypothetical protein [Picosynechococcus sp. PCC 7002]ANV90663.1 hypothetical protein AWQ24_08495 [Picosynechococcus sp. PCC 8807]SMH28381.1 Uncharacterized conserved protein, contains DUF3084 domain [Picosynechococcus sp. OG1]SMQ83562.1 Uncharacterized conserved protein, contains DUF3084 domain [Synechococcus sp. 7002]